MVPVEAVPPSKLIVGLLSVNFTVVIELVKTSVPRLLITPFFTGLVTGNFTVV